LSRSSYDFIIIFYKSTFIIIWHVLYVDHADHDVDRTINHTHSVMVASYSTALQRL